MKTLIRNTIFALTALAVSANAQTLSVQSIEAEAGSQANVVVSIGGVEANTTALQFNLAMPDGVTLNETGISTGTAASNHGYEVRSLDSGERLIVIFDMNLGSIQNGELLILPVTIGTTEGTFSGSLSTVRFSDTDAVSKEGDGTSFTITAKRPEQPVTITANNLTMVYGDEVPELTYKTEGAALEGTPSLTTTATKTSAVGTYPINVGVGSVTNTKTTYVAGTLTITKAPLTVTAKSYTIKQGDALPTFEAEYSGFKNNETASVLSTQPTVRTTATSASEPGTYDIIVSGAAANNYDITCVKGTLTITKADEVVVTAKSYSRQYGEVNPTFEYTSSGATLSGTPSITCAATATSPVGEYEIVAGKGSVTSYNVTYVNGKLTITKAPLTITAKSYTIKQGDALPTFEAEYSGFKNNETASVLGVQPTIRTTATSTNEPGTYDIIVSGAAASNYDITYVKGTLTITQADPVTVAAKSYSRQYGDANPTFEYTSSGATLSGTPSITCAATATSPVGEYDIAASKGSVTNYNVTYVNGKLTITKAPLTVTAKSYTIKQGDALPTFEAEYSGFKNNETASVLSTQPTVRTTATSASEPGTYDIIVSGASATNYDITYVKGTLTITKAEEVAPTPSSDALLSVQDTKGYIGKTVSVDIDLNNSTEDLTAYQFDLTLPEGLSLSQNDKGKFLVTKTSRYEDDSHTLNISKLEGNTYRFVCFSMSNEVITGTSGAILNASLTIGESVSEGSYEATISNIVVTKTDGTQLKLSDSKFNIVVTNVIKGDANGDGEVNVSDIVEIVNYIMNKPSDKFVFAAADVNEDGEVNVTDIVKVVSIIMSANSSQAKMSAAQTEMTDNDLVQLVDNEDQTISLTLNNEGGYVASQFDLVLSDNQSLESITLNNNRTDNHILAYTKTGENRYRVLSYSLNNAIYGGHSGELLDIKVAGSGNVSVEDILFVTAEETEKRFSPLHSVTTGISMTTKRAEAMDIYSVDGRLVHKQAKSMDGLERGIYIINGKKHIVR